MSKEEQDMLIVWLDEVYEIDMDADKSGGYIIQHLKETVKEFYAMKHKFIDGFKAHERAMKYLAEQEVK